MRLEGQEDLLPPTHPARVLRELTNEHRRCLRGIDQFLVRGLNKVTIVLLSALATNLLQHATTLLS